MPLRMSEKTEFYLKFSVPFIIIIAAIFNLTITTEKQEMWLLLLCTCMAYLMPGPEVKNSIKTLIPEKSEITENKI